MTRLDKLRIAMKEQGIDAVLVLEDLNRRYLSEFSCSSGMLLITVTAAYLITDFRYYEMALNQASKQFEVLDLKGVDERHSFIEKAFLGCKTVGFEGDYMSYASYLSFKEKHPSFEFVNIGSMIETLRQIKTADELLSMQKAQDIADNAFSVLMKNLNPSQMTEIDVAVELEYLMRKSGAEGMSFDTIAVSGDASALPHGTPRNVKLKKGFLTMDFGAKVDGYCSDMTRTVVIGKPTEDIKRLYNTVLLAQTSALEYLKAGCDCGEADKIARDIINKDYDGTFGHSLGHAVGLLVHESPALSPRGFGNKLVVGNVVTVEPGIYIFGKYGCRIEDMVAITEDGVYNFTHSTKEMLVFD